MRIVEPASPRYVVVFNALRERIENGTHPPGSKLPSESELMREFHTGRNTVIRALQILFNDEWIDGEKGLGRFVRERRPAEPRPIPGYAAALLSDELTDRVRIIDVAEVPASTRAMNALGLTNPEPVVVRRRLVAVDGLGPVELGTAFIPAPLAAGTAVRSLEPLREGLLKHLEKRKGVQFDHVTERISIRPAAGDEVRYLEIDPQAWVLTVLYTVHLADGTPGLALDVAIAPGRQELQDSYQLA